MPEVEALKSFHIGSNRTTAPKSPKGDLKEQFIFPLPTVQEGRRDYIRITLPIIISVNETKCSSFSLS